MLWQFAVKMLIIVLLFTPFFSAHSLGAAVLLGIHHGAVCLFVVAMYVGTGAQVSACTYVRVYVSVYVCKNEGMYVCMLVSMHIIK